MSVDFSICAATRSPGLTPRATSALAACAERVNNSSVGQRGSVVGLESQLVQMGRSRRDEVEQICGWMSRHLVSRLKGASGD